MNKNSPKELLNSILHPTREMKSARADFGMSLHRSIEDDNLLILEQEQRLNSLGVDSDYVRYPPECDDWPKFFRWLIDADDEEVIDWASTQG